MIENCIMSIYDSHNHMSSIPGLSCQNMLFILINHYNEHWQLIIILHALNNEKATITLFLESLVRVYNPMFRMHVSHRHERETEELEIDFLNRFIESFLVCINPVKHEAGKVPKIKIIDSVQQQGADCGFCVLKNIEMAIDLHDEFIADCNSRHFLVKIRTYYHREDATLLRKEIVTLLSAFSGFRFVELQIMNDDSSRNSKNMN